MGWVARPPVLTIHQHLRFEIIPYPSCQYFKVIRTARFLSQRRTHKWLVSSHPQICRNGYWLLLLLCKLIILFHFHCNFFLICICLLLCTIESTMYIFRFVAPSGLVQPHSSKQWTVWTTSAKCIIWGWLTVRIVPTMEGQQSLHLKS